jgi:hypothetical protein
MLIALSRLAAVGLPRQGVDRRGGAKSVSSVRGHPRYVKPFSTLLGDAEDD